jgi:hypothetical protein
MVTAGLARATINATINRICRMFRCASSVERLPSWVVESLRTVDGLREGQTEAREDEPVGPVPIEHVKAVLPFLPDPVAATVQLHRHVTEQRALSTCHIRVFGMGHRGVRRE